MDGGEIRCGWYNTTVSTSSVLIKWSESYWLFMNVNSYELAASKLYEYLSKKHWDGSVLVGGLVDVVKDGQTSVLVPPADTKGLGEAIISLLKNPLRRQKMGQHAKQFADTELAWEAIARKTMAVYQKVKLV